MKIKFLGTGAAEGVPAIFCDCAICNNIRSIGKKEFRTRSQVLIDDCLFIDFPPDAYAHSLKSGINFGKIKYLLVTHSHMDHFYAHDFILRGYKYSSPPECKLEIFGNAEVKKVFDECTAREMKAVVAPNLSFKEIKPYQVFSVEDYKVITIPASHSKVEDALLFYIERGGKAYLHFYDTGRISLNALDFLAQNGAKADLVCFDCTFLDSVGGPDSRHMGIEDNMLMKDELLKRGIINGDSKLVISHFSHNSNPLRSRLREFEKAHSVTAAFDGFTVEI